MLIAQEHDYRDDDGGLDSNEWSREKKFLHSYMISLYFEASNINLRAMRFSLDMMIFFLPMDRGHGDCLERKQPIILNLALLQGGRSCTKDLRQEV